MHILYLHQYFSTLDGSSGTRSFEFSRLWAKEGHKVTVITGQYDIGGMHDHSRRFIDVKLLDHITVIVIGIPYSNKQSFMRRVISFIAFVICSIYVGMHIKGIDAVYATSTPLTIGIPALILKRLRRIPFVFEVRDQWPESIIELGMLKNKLLIKILLWLEKNIYDKSSAIVAVSEGMANDIRKISGPSKAICVIPNGADLNLFSPDIDGSLIRNKRGWNNKLVLINAGALGKVHGLEFVIDVAVRLKNQKNILFVLVGQGAKKIELENKISELHLTNVEILPAMPKRELSQLLSAADIIMAIIGKYPIIERHASLNKFYDGLSAGKPILLNYSGWQRDLIELEKAGFGCSLCDVGEFTQNVMKLFMEREKLIAMGQKARKIAEQKFDRAKLALKALDILCEIKR